MHYSTLKELFDNELKNVKFTPKLVRDINLFQVGFTVRNQDHAEFFGGHLTGCHVLRFNNADFSKWYELFDVNDQDLTKKMHKIPSVNPAFKITSDLFNVLNVYLAHRFLVEESLPEKLRLQAAKDVLLVIQYRTISAIITQRFIYPADPNVAQRTFERLSNRFLLKKIGSWQKLFEYRSDELLSKDSIHLRALLKFNNDTEILYCVSDMHNRISDAIKNIYSVHMQTHAAGDSVTRSGGTGANMEGEVEFKDKHVRESDMVDYVTDVLGERNNFVRNELMDIVLSSMKTVQESNLRQTLNWLTDNALSTHRKEILAFVENVFKYALGYLTNEGRPDNPNDISQVIGNLRGSLMSSRSSDEVLLTMRDDGSFLVKQATGRTNEQTIAGIRTSVILYIFLRGYLKDYFTR
jgi:hypothetical protein